MLEKNVIVKLKSGLQARPAALFVQEANRFSSDISIESESRTVNAKSIMGIMSLAIGSGKIIKIIADGSDEAEALEVLTKFVEDENN
jgi:catabolite repression HPr-like protein